MAILKRDDRQVITGKPDLDKNNKLTPKSSWLHFAFHYVEVFPDGTARIHDKVGKSYVGGGMGGGTFKKMPLSQAIAKVREWDRFTWNADTNDRHYLCDEYGLRESFVRSYFGVMGIGIDDGPHSWNEN